jgi:dTDP-N-acetylfucosamine:lipid II N-acetylfucosaminyltransferase
MIVHLFEDQKFVDNTIINFDSQSVDLNKYIVFSNTKDLKYVFSTDRVLVLPNSSYKLDLDLIYKDCQLLIIHFLTPIKLYILKHKPPHVKVLWSVWGSDAYDHFQKQDFFEQLTQNIQKESIYQQLRFSRLYSLYHLLRYRVKPLRKELKLLNKIDFISTVLPYEFDLINKEFNLRLRYIDFNYSVNQFNKTLPFNLGNSILIGNSATLSNNHLDIFEIIKNINCKVIVPLSYGAYGYQDYKEIVISKGVSLFGENFHAIVDFLPIQDYDKILMSCNTMIMYHIRQQALGNIYMALYIGMRVFFNKESITYRYLIDEGMIVFELEKEYDLVGVELGKCQKDINRELVIKLQGKNAINRKVKGIISLHNSLDRS